MWCPCTLVLAIPPSLALQHCIDVVGADVNSRLCSLQGILRGYDQATNLILDECFERVYSTKASYMAVVNNGCGLRLSGFASWVASPTRVKWGLCSGLARGAGWAGLDNRCRHDNRPAQAHATCGPDTHWGLEANHVHPLWSMAFDLARDSLSSLRPLCHARRVLPL